jgi:metal-responsive CopG/Arc/MetJ family transcriptional regulator
VSRAAQNDGIDRVALRGNTFGMKVAVSIPDDVFAETEDLAKQLKASRSELYSRALSEFVRRHAPDRVTELMNQVVAAVGEESDPFSKRAARRVMRRVEW